MAYPKNKSTSILAANGINLHNISSSTGIATAVGRYDCIAVAIGSNSAHTPTWVLCNSVVHHWQK